jgi:hypothetical protein
MIWDDRTFPAAPSIFACGHAFLTIKSLLEQWSGDKPGPVCALKLLDDPSSLQNGNLHNIFTFVEYTFSAVPAICCTVKTFYGEHDL